MRQNYVLKNREMRRNGYHGSLVDYGSETEYERPFLANTECEKAKVLAKPSQNFCEIPALGQNMTGRNIEVEKRHGGGIKIQFWICCTYMGAVKIWRPKNRGKTLPKFSQNAACMAAGWFCEYWDER